MSKQPEWQYQQTSSQDNNEHSQTNYVNMLTDGLDR